jgi:hypothetical protein
MEERVFLNALQPYCEAFVEHEVAKRMALLAAAMTADAEIWGPKRVFAGCAQISEKIDGFQKNWPECRLVLASGLNTFLDCARLGQAIVDRNSAVRASGHSFIELAADGRIRRVVAFWDALPPLPSDWPARFAAPG